MDTQRRNLIAVCISTGILRTGFTGFIIVLSVYAAIRGPLFFTSLDVGIIALTYYVGELLTAPFFGGLSDYLGRKKIMVSGVLFASFSISLFSTTNSVLLLALIHLLEGCGAAANIAPSLAMVSEQSRKSTRGFSFGAYDLTTFAGFFLGFLIGGILLDVFKVYEIVENVNFCYFSMALLILISAVILLIFIKEEETDKKTVDTTHLFDGIINTFKRKEIRDALPLWLAITTLLGVVLTFGPYILARSGKFSGLEIGVALSVPVMAFLLMFPIWGYLSDRFGRFKILAIGVIALAGLVLTLIFAVLQGIAVSDIRVLMIVGIFALFVSAITPTILALVGDLTTEQHGSTFGIYSLALGLGQILGSFFGGITLHNYGEIGLLMFCGIVVFIGIIFLTRFSAEKES